MIKTPNALMPIQTDVMGQPIWYSKSPRYLRITDDLAITLDDVCGRDRDGKVWTARKGYPTDGMSYPRVVSWFKDRYDLRTRRSSTMHDFRYSMHDYCWDWHNYDDRQHADFMLLDGLRLDEPNWARIDYISVRLCGNPIYENECNDKMMKEWIGMAAVGDDLLMPYCEGMIEQYGKKAIF